MPAPGETIRITKLASYHSSTGVPPQELADRCSAHAGSSRRRRVRSSSSTSSAAGSTSFWARSDVELRGDDAAQQAMRWNLFQLAQASARTHENGIAAKGVTGAGYEGHYFWDTEIYVVPFLAYTDPETARSLLRFRWHMLPQGARSAPSS